MILNTFLGFSLARLKRVSSKLCRPANFHRHTQLPFTPIPCALLLGPLSTLCIVQGSACALCRAAHCGARCKVFIRSPKQERSQPTVAALKWGGLRSPVTWSTWCWRRFLKIIMSDLIIKMAMLLIKCWQSSASRGAEQPLLVVENMLMRIVMMVMMMIRERVAKIRGAGSVNHSV